MRSGIVSGTRSNFYDRSLGVVNKHYNSITNWDDIQIQWTYTVPASRILIVTSLSLMTKKMAGAVSNDFIYQYISVVPDGGVETILLSCGVTEDALYNQNDTFIGSALRLNPSDVIKCTTIGNDSIPTPFMHGIAGMSGNLYDA